MARIAGVDLPRNKRIEIALTYIFGLGRHAANVVLREAGISPDKKSDDLDESDVRKIRDAIESAAADISSSICSTRLLIRRMSSAVPETMSALLRVSAANRTRPRSCARLLRPPPAGCGWW